MFVDFLRMRKKLQDQKPERVKMAAVPPAPHEAEKKVRPFSVHFSSRARKKLGWAEFVCRRAN